MIRGSVIDMNDRRLKPFFYALSQKGIRRSSDADNQWTSSIFIHFLYICRKRFSSFFSRTNALQKLLFGDSGWYMIEEKAVNGSASLIHWKTQE